MKLTIRHLTATATAVLLMSSAHAAVTTASFGDAKVIAENDMSSGVILDYLGGGSSMALSNGGISPITQLLVTSEPPKVVTGTVGVLNVLKAELSPVDNGAINESNVTLASGRESRAFVQISGSGASTTFDVAAGQYVGTQSSGGITLTAPAIDGSADGGSVSVSNLRVDLPGKAVYADVSYQALPRVTVEGGTDPERVTKTSLKVWSFDTFEGPTGISGQALTDAANGDFGNMLALGYTLLAVSPGVDEAHPTLTVQARNRLSNLHLTQDGFDALVAGFGLTAPEGSAYNYIAYDALRYSEQQPEGWGDMEVTSIFSIAAVPEPSTYALMGLGLAGMADLRFRRRG